MLEIERKFKVTGDFRKEATGKVSIVQGYLCTEKERTVRVRIKGENGYLTVKGPSNENGFSHLEFEYPVPLEDARRILTLCNNRIDKERYLVPCGKHTFEVDVFHGNHEGLIIAEIELSSEQEAFEKPDWLGEEVTGQEEYYNAWLAKCG